VCNSRSLILRTQTPNTYNKKGKVHSTSTSLASYVIYAGSVFEAITNNEVSIMLGEGVFMVCLKNVTEDILTFRDVLAYIGKELKEAVDGERK